MLFNSDEFILLFLPVTVAGFLLFGRGSRSLAWAWLIAASIFFYAWWRPFNLVIIGSSIAVNFAFACVLLRLAREDSRRRLRTLVLTSGILFNVAFLGYFKYANFLVIAANDLTGSNFVLAHIILPLGISFITFQKIALLVDVAGGRVESFTTRDFLLFVLFFPPLISGPIVHYRELIPQVHAAKCRFNADMFAAAFTLFCFGLFKKVVLADGIAQYVSPIFAAAAAGEVMTLPHAWFAAVGFTEQIYFDFSGYSDMACGAALFFGLRLPINFDSPLRASSIIDFWVHWHMTLTRFLTAYIYNPIALALLRRRSAKGMSTLSSRGSSAGAFVSVLVWPVLATMLVSGAWHGAGYTFLLWGLLHGVYLIVNHAWRQYGPASTPPKGMRPPFVTFIGFILTFVAVTFGMILFRAPDLASAVNLVKGFVGFHGILPVRDVANAAPIQGELVAISLRALAYLAGLLVIALLMPNSLQMMSKYEPALYIEKHAPQVAGVGPSFYWRPSIPWMGFIAVLAAVSMIRLSGRSEFLYWQF